MVSTAKGSNGNILFDNKNVINSVIKMFYTNKSLILEMLLFFS